MTIPVSAYVYKEVDVQRVKAVFPRSVKGQHFQQSSQSLPIQRLLSKH